MYAGPVGPEWGGLCRPQPGDRTRHNQRLHDRCRGPCHKPGQSASFSVCWANQETGPDITSVYMTVAADLVISQVSLLLFLSAELKQETGPDITSVYMARSVLLFSREPRQNCFIFIEKQIEGCHWKCRVRVSVVDPDPGSGIRCFLTPGSGMEKTDI